MRQNYFVIITCCFVIAQAFPDDSYMHPHSIYKAAEQRAVGDKPEPSEHWRTSAQSALAEKLKEEKIVKKAKNVIMFLGDGWGVPTMTAARILKGQKIQNVTFGEEGTLHVDTFPHSGMSKTFCSDAQVADSACSATAYLCGIKANSGTMGVTADVPRYNCSAQADPKNHVSSILAWAQEQGKATGVVTTARVTHASPGGTYAHIANRDWECDEDMKGVDPVCLDIAQQLILSEPGKNIDVIMGGGRRKFLPKTFIDSEGIAGEREDGKNLIDMWKTSRSRDGNNATFVDNVNDLMSVDVSKTDALLGLFASDHLEYYHEQKDNADPSLTDMTVKAIEILNKNPNGFFLFVEAGRIDHAHHDNFALRSLWEAVEFDRAIEEGDKLTDDEDTLIVVTADHSHAFSFAGYAARGRDLTGFGGLGFDNLLPYSILNYANGPGFKGFAGEKRHDMTKDGDKIHELTYQQTPLVHLDSETHGGEDVMILSKGPFSHLLTGVQQQSYIPHVMAYASCLGPGLKCCDESQPCNTKTSDTIPTTTPSSAKALTLNSAIFLILSTMVRFI